MKQYKIIWFDVTKEIKTDIVSAASLEDARSKGYFLYNGNPPGTNFTIMCGNEFQTGTV